MPHNSARSALGIIFCLVCALLCAGTHHLAESATRSEKPKDPQEAIPLEYLPSLQSISLLSLGHRNALADFFWVRAMLYLHNTLMHKQQFLWLNQYITLIKTLDPRFEDIYHWGSTVMLFTREEIRYEDVERANHILDQGLKVFPKNYRILSSAAANCSYYVQNPSEEEREKLLACRRDYFQRAANSPDAPYHAILLASQLYKNKGEVDTGKMCEFLATMYTSRNDPALREQIERKMNGGICGQTSIKQLKLMKLRFQEAHEASYPYIHPDLAVHMTNFEDFAPPSNTSKENLP